MASRGRCIALVACIAAISACVDTTLAQTPQANAPRPPCAGATTPTEPPYGALNEQPRVKVWQDITLRLDESCGAQLSGPFELAVALAGRFHSAETVDGMAGKIGAVSAMRGLPYWSVTDARWRPLINDVFAVHSASSRVARADFSAAEVLGGATLYFAQDDSRSSGLNIYALRAIQVAEETLAIETYNVTRIRLFLLTLFKAHSLRALHYLRRGVGDTWHYYGLSLVKEVGVGGHERSVINRAATYYRYLAGQAIDGAPPLAP